MRFKKKILQKLNDEVLQKNLTSFAKAYKQSRSDAFAGLSFEELRGGISDLKNRSRGEIIELFELFRRNVESSGGKVFQAKRIEDANRYIEEVCKANKAQLIVKSKSMTSEETRLNDYLIKKGITPIESDLGEWILQLANEHPSHMVMPAIHKSREQVAELFKRVLRENVEEDDIEGMVKIARRKLREYYFAAGVGFTGANFAIASTGTVGIVTNEGNARLTTTVPPVHIVLMGYEKLVRNFSEAFKILEVLPKSATGQNISTYVTWIKGSVPSAKNSSGKKEIHYVFLDNGRLNYFDDPTYHEALKCIRCGSCANVCPVYEMLGGHVFGDIYVGAIGLVKTALLQGHRDARQILKLCIECKACNDFCPSGIELQGIISKLKMESGDEFGIGRIKRGIYSGVLAKPKTFKRAGKIGFILQKPFVNGDGSVDVPFLSKTKDFRKLKGVQKRSFSELYAENYQATREDAERVLFYPGCAIEFVYPHLGMKLVNLLNGYNFKVDVPDEVLCCGMPAAVSGDRKSFSKIMASNLSFLDKLKKYDELIVLCPTCGSCLKEVYPDFGIDEDISGMIDTKVVSVGQFMTKRKIEFEIECEGKVTYHSPCHQSRGLDYSPEAILMDNLADKFIPLNDSNVCCGFGGTYSFDYADISKGIVNKKYKNIIDTQAETVITDCPGCIMQIEGYMKKEGSDIKVRHLVEILK
ncbi:MAG: LUD domain-containing protein [Bacteroidetes bacterium]|nr:LUD domain-containing protein [Bacteroidota bacterium]